MIIFEFLQVIIEMIITAIEIITIVGFHIMEVALLQLKQLMVQEVTIKKRPEVISSLEKVKIVQIGIH